MFSGIYNKAQSAELSFREHNGCEGVVVKWCVLSLLTRS